MLPPFQGAHTMWPLLQASLLAVARAVLWEVRGWWVQGPGFGGGALGVEGPGGSRFQGLGFGTWGQWHAQVRLALALGLDLKKHASHRRGNAAEAVLGTPYSCLCTTLCPTHAFALPSALLMSVMFAASSPPP